MFSTEQMTMMDEIVVSVQLQEPSIREIPILAFVAGFLSATHTYEYTPKEIELAFFRWWFATQ